jgi:hypothetical protein
MKSGAGKGPDPRPMSKEGRANYERTMRNIYGVRVKIPPPGPELEELVGRLERRMGSGEYKHEPCGVCIEEGERCDECCVRIVLEILAEEG